MEDRVTVSNGSLRTHGLTECMGRNCCIHSPSAHPLSEAPMHWRFDRGIMERICSHGVGHPDRDDVTYRTLLGEASAGVHGCCEGNCCSEGGKA